MCDYSLCGLPSRLAVEGEQLIAHRFQNGCMGLVSPVDLHQPTVTEPPKLGFWARIVRSFDFEPTRDPTMVVCMPPGALLIVRDIPESIQQRLNIGSEEGAVFVQLSAKTNTYRDALRFASGQTALLQSLQEGMNLDVLSLGDAPRLSDRTVAVPVL